MEFEKKIFGDLSGETIYEYTLTNSQGVSLSALNLGGVVTSIKTPDKAGQFSNITLGFDNVEDYLTYRPFYGALVGRVAGRIAEGRFNLEGKEYQLQVNEGENHHHGGNPAFESHIWDVSIEEGEASTHLIFKYFSPAGENGYPANLVVTITYTLSEANEWKISYHAETDEPTLFNPTNHVYFNLSGDHTKTIKEHTLQVNSDLVGELKEDGIPTGKFLPVNDTDFDLREPVKLSKGITSQHPQLADKKGFDHPFFLAHRGSEPDAVLCDSESGRKVIVTTDCDALVVYTHNGVSGEYEINGNRVEPYAGVALETQTMPDAINQDNFGNITLYPGETFHSETIYQFEQVKGCLE